MIYIESPARNHADRPDLALIHGWCMSARIWNSLIPLLEPVANVWRVELPGHARAAACDWPADYRAVTRSIAGHLPPGAIWLGWSLAGIIAIDAALSGYAGALIMLASNPRFVAADDWPGMPEHIFTGFRNGFRNDPQGTLIAFQRLQFGNRSLPRAAQEQLRDSLTAIGENNHGALLQALDCLGATDLSGRLAAIDVPVLMCGSAADRLVPVEALRQARELIPDCRFELLPEAGHVLMLEQPGALARWITGFLHGL